MDFIFEFLFEIILEGCFEAISEKKIPFVVRIIIALILFIFYICFGGIFLYIGIKQKSVLLIGISIFLYIIIGIVAFRKYEELKRK